VVQFYLNFYHLYYSYYAYHYVKENIQVLLWLKVFLANDINVIKLLFWESLDVRIIYMTNHGFEHTFEIISFPQYIEIKCYLLHLKTWCIWLLHKEVSEKLQWCFKGIPLDCLNVWLCSLSNFTDRKNS
jgi:hypothetical protein